MLLLLLSCLALLLLVFIFVHSSWETIFSQYLDKKSWASARHDLSLFAGRAKSWKMMKNNDFKTHRKRKASAQNDILHWLVAHRAPLPVASPLIVLTSRPTSHCPAADSASVSEWVGSGNVFNVCLCLYLRLCLFVGNLPCFPARSALCPTLFSFLLWTSGFLHIFWLLV